MKVVVRTMFAVVVVGFLTSMFAQQALTADSPKDRVVVMYGGRIVEEAPVGKLFEYPQHPYTRGLLRSMPRIDDRKGKELYTIDGQPPDLQALPSGCSFEPRCEFAFERCREEIPELRSTDEMRVKACHLDHLK